MHRAGNYGAALLVYAPVGVGVEIDVPPVEEMPFNAHMPLKYGDIHPTLEVTEMVCSATY